MSFLYPNLITLSRPGTTTGQGKVGYAGATQATETVVVAGVKCNLELRREGQRDTTGLPGDGTRPTYDCRIPRGVMANGTVKLRDIVTDENGLRYQVLAPFWSSLGYALRVELLAA